MGDKENKRVRSQSMSSIEVELFGKESPIEDEKEPTMEGDEIADEAEQAQSEEESRKTSDEKPLKERPYEDMVITPMPGILPIQLNPPYRPPEREPLPYSECRGKIEEELIFHLEMDF